MFWPQYRPMYGPTANRNENKSTGIVKMVAAALSHMGLTSNPPKQGVKTSVSVRYSADPIKRHEKKTSLHSRSAGLPDTKRKEGRPVVWGQVTVSVYLLGCKYQKPRLLFIDSHHPIRFVKEVKQVKIEQGQ